VRKVLVDGPDAHARDPGDPIRGDGRDAVAFQDALDRVEHRFDGELRAALLGSSAGRHECERSYNFMREAAPIRARERELRRCTARSIFLAMNILVTGATGTVGRLVVAALRARGEEPRRFVRNPQAAGPNDVVGDLADPTTLALDGVEALFLLTTGSAIAEHDAAVAKRARAAGVKRIVKLSSLDVARPDTAATGVWHGAGEAAIRASGIAWTFVRPVGFMSNALSWAPAIAHDGVVRSSTGDGRIAMIHPADIAAVAATALLGGWEEQALAITGPRALTYAEMVACLGDVLGRSLRFEAISDEAARARLGARLPDDVADALVGLWRSVREGQVAMTTGEVERVTGRTPRTFRQWCEENAAAFR
jgi:uncharacterized protein YbjT (DUF2867 family)